MKTRSVLMGTGFVLCRCHIHIGMLLSNKDYLWFLLNENRPTELIKSHAFYLVSDVGCYFEMDNS